MDHGDLDQVLALTYDVALLDLDGVVYIGPDAVDHAPAALKSARAEGMRLAFVTNNASRPPEEVAAHLTELGVEALPAEVITSAQAAARLLAERVPAGSAVLVVGGEGLTAALEERGLVPVRSLAERPVAVVQGFAPDVDWRALAEGSYAVASGLPWVASNVDRTVPTPRGLAPGNGAFVDAVRAATGRDPVVAGKPEPPMHREAMVRSGAIRPLVVGDRLDTDIEGAVRAGVDSLLVLTGVTSPAQLVLAPAHVRPTYIGVDLRALQAPASSLAVAAGQVEYGQCRAEVTGGRLFVHHRDDAPRASAQRPAGSHPAALDVLRAACGATWATENVDPRSVVAALEPWWPAPGGTPGEGS
ncbi:HAD-IIA family hydrolase [Phytoactinopolyspora limicola]|uniref:HAD-IIA family hydrolase n=1 Tax=Phytoactinopolyspora limicola TaxID=2715536 RepID=UPI001B7D8A69|nr:HAD-IIA family hydrolase [Phytoactinopolyspora limicola]